MLPEILTVILLPFLGTTIGAGFVFFLKGQMNRTLQRSLTGFAAGVSIHRAQLLGYSTIYLEAKKTDYYRRQGWCELDQYLHQKSNKVYYKNLLEQR